MTYPGSPPPPPQPHGAGYPPPDWAPPQPPKKRRWPWIVGGLFGLLVLGVIVSPSQPAQTPTSAAVPTPVATVPAVPAAAPAQSAAASPAGTIPQGEWMVGAEVAPGKYRSTGAEPGLFELCSATTKDANGQVIDWKTANAGEPVLLKVTSKAATVQNVGCEPFVKIG